MQRRCETRLDHTRPGRREDRDGRKEESTGKSTVMEADRQGVSGEEDRSGHGRRVQHPSDPCGIHQSRREDAMSLMLLG